MIEYWQLHIFFASILAGGISLIGNPSGPPPEKDSALLLDILGDINFGTGTSNNPPPTSSSTMAQQQGSLLDMLGDLDMTSPSQPPPTSILSQNHTVSKKFVKLKDF